MADASSSSPSPPALILGGSAFGHSWAPGSPAAAEAEAEAEAEADAAAAAAAAAGTPTSGPGFGWDDFFDFPLFYKRSDSASASATSGLDDHDVDLESLASPSEQHHHHHQHDVGMPPPTPRSMTTDPGSPDDSDKDLDNTFRFPSSSPPYTSPPTGDPSASASSSPSPSSSIAPIPSREKRPRPRSGDRTDMLLRHPYPPSLQIHPASGPAAAAAAAAAVSRGHMTSPPRSPDWQGQQPATGGRTGTVVVVNRRQDSPPLPLPPAKKARVLPHPDKTNQVRRMGACLRCRIGRLKCDTSEVCAMCTDASKKLQSPHAHDVCIRKDLVEILGSRYFRWSFHSRKFIPTENKRRKTYISFSGPGIQGPCLQVPVGQTMVDSKIWYGIPSGEGPSDQSLDRWVEETMFWERRDTFGGRMENVLREFVNADALRTLAAAQRGGGPSPSPSPSTSTSTSISTSRVDTVIGTVASLLANLRRLTLAMRLWGADAVFVRRSVQDLDAHEIKGPIQPIADRLRQMAEETMAKAERAVLGNLDAYVAAESTVRKEDHPLLWQGLNVAVWIATTQLMLLYQRALDGKARPVHASDEAAAVAARTRQRDFMDVNKKLFHAVCVIHSELFRTRNVLNSLGEARPDVFRGHKGTPSAQLCDLFHQAWQAHFHYYEECANDAAGNDFFRYQVVAKEKKILSRKPSNKRKE
ncbi:hypothetical protein P8C59_006995 [Phyllachora maydis]|uniref:Uncharacterized protein n=1 Tax=Phyllachora maydis TaxID=1825666 RepID=A0AAD9I7U2_9PEZI|nr:hypothetical protein P8C59_006995 [Phyllachora maydis]